MGISLIQLSFELQPDFPASRLRAAENIKSTRAANATDDHVANGRRRAKWPPSRRAAIQAAAAAAEVAAAPRWPDEFNCGQREARGADRVACSRTSTASGQFRSLANHFIHLSIYAAARAGPT